MTEGRIVTFYSFKGGTGRSMALANIAHVLSLDSTDPNILMIDWDLEAPGLHRYFENALTPLSASRSLWPGRNQKSVDTYLGLIDLLETAFSAYQKDDLATAAAASSWHPSTASEADPLDRMQARRKRVRDGLFANLDQYLLQCESGQVFLMKAGAFDPEDAQPPAKKDRDFTLVPYAERIRRFDWEGFHKCDPDFFPAFRRHLMARFNYVLIDSRTGLTDSSGICTKQMPEVLILVFAPNQQNIDGLVNVVHGVKSYRYGSIDSRPVMIYPVASRINGQYQPLRDTWRKGGEDDGKAVKGYQLRFEELLKDTYDLESCDLTAYFDLTQIPHDGAYAYGEKLASKLGTSDTLSIGWRYANLARLLTASRPPWEAGVETADAPAAAKQSAPTAPIVFRKWLPALVALASLVVGGYRGYSEVFRYFQQRSARLGANTARGKLAAGDAQGAVIDFSSAVQKLPDDVSLYRDRAYAFKILGNDQKAMEDYDHVLSLQTDIRTLRDRAYMYRVLANPAKADADYQAILRIAPKDMDALLGHAYLSREAGRYEEALRAYTPAISQQSSDPSLYIDRGVTFFLKGDRESAKSDLQAAVRLDPNNAYARSLLVPLEQGKKSAGPRGLLDQATRDDVVTGWLFLGRVDETGKWASDSPRNIANVPLSTFTETSFEDNERCAPSFCCSAA